MDDIKKLPAVSELSDSQLDSVVGGTDIQVQQLEPTVSEGSSSVFLGVLKPLVKVVLNSKPHPTT